MVVREQLAKRLPDHIGEPRDYYPAVVMNAALVAGTVIFRWNVVELILLYMLEIAIINILFIGTSLFAPRPIREHLREPDEEYWDRDPVPLVAPSGFPPIYRRNVRFAAKQTVLTVILLTAIGYLSRAIGPFLTPSIGIAVVGICVSQAVRVWRRFLAARQYRTRTPAEALKFGMIPLIELYLILMYVIPPVTVVVVGSVIALDIDVSRFLLLAYLIPIAVIRVYIQGTDWHPHLDEE